ncbi:MAG: DUF1570 domain-containing protein [Planctomycetota bacterium]|jgi:hypothetical protein
MLHAAPAITPRRRDALADDRHRRRIRRTAVGAAAAALLLAGAATGRAAEAAEATDRPIAERIAEHDAAAERAGRDGRRTDRLGHLAAIVRLAPDRTDAWDGLRTESPRPPAADSRSLAAARRDVPRGFREERSTHFVILTDADAAWTLGVSRRLEQAHRDFESFIRRLELEAVPLRHRLVCIVFRDKRAFETFARERDGVAASWAHGYYSPVRDRIVLYQPPSGGDRFAEARAIAAIHHEVTHQLSFHRLVQDRTVQYPLWLNEGLATSFEAAADDPAAGPWSAFEARERRLRRLHAEQRLLPLEEFLGLTSLGDADPDRIEMVYGQCYGFFSWLATTRPTAVAGFLAAMHAEPPGPVSAERLRTLFQERVGAIGSVEAAWRRTLADAGGVPEAREASPRLMLTADRADASMDDGRFAGPQTPRASRRRDRDRDPAPEGAAR